jgi:quercetin dioxygenase-like cupin family protein
MSELHEGGFYNPRTGQEKVVLKRGDETNGEYVQIESWNEPGRPGEPFHRHPYSSTTFHILAGEMAFEVNGEILRGKAGEDVFVPANATHHFWNDGKEVCHHIQEFKPAMKIDQFFETLFGFAQDDKLNDKGTPKSLLQLAVTMPHYRNEIRMVKPPHWLVMTICYALYPIAYALGNRATQERYHHYDRSGVEARAESFAAKVARGETSPETPPIPAP